MRSIRLEQTEETVADKNLATIASEQNVTTRGAQKWVAKARALGWNLGTTQADGSITYSRDEEILILKARYGTLDSAAQPPAEEMAIAPTTSRAENHKRIQDEGLVIQNQADGRVQRLQAVRHEALTDVREEFNVYAETYTGGRVAMEEAKRLLKTELDCRLSGPEVGAGLTADELLRGF